MATATVDTASVTKALTQKLRHSGLEKESLAELVKAVAKLHVEGLSRIIVFPKGIPPVYDGLKISGIVEAASIGPILESLLKHNYFGKFTVFPLGVLAHEAYQVELELNGGQG